MPEFTDATTADAPVEDVWKLLYDPARFPEWMAGLTAVDVGADGAYTAYLDGAADFPMPQVVRADGRTVTVSCLVSDLEFAWRLEPHGDTTAIAVHVVLPEREAVRLDAQRELVARSLRALADLAARRG